MGKNKYKGLRSYAQEKVTAPKKIMRGGKVEELSYINKDEAKILKRYGGSGVRTKHGVPSYGFWSDLATVAGFSAPARIQAASNIASTVRETFSEAFASKSAEELRNMPPPERAAYERKNAERDRKRAANRAYSPEEVKQKVVPRDETETIPNPAPKFDLKDLYAKRNDKDAMQEYLDQYKGGNEAKPSVKNSTGGTTKYVYEAVETGVPGDFGELSNEERWYKDEQGRILGWQNKEGMPGFANKNQWQFDENEDTWVFVGEGSEAGGGGTGTTTALDPDTGDAVIIGARTYAEQIGYDKDKLKRAEEDRGKEVKKLKSMADKYGGKYDDETGEFLGGGLEEKFLSQSDQYDQKVAQMYGLDVQKKKTNPDGSPALDESGQPVMETVKGDTFWKDMEDDAGKLPTDLQAKLYGKRADEITAGESEQTADLQRMMAERNIDPTSPQAMRMRQQVKSGSRTAQRQARRASLGDAMQVQQQQQQQRLGIRGAQLAGMEAQGARMFSQGAHYGAKSQEISGLLLEEATDRQRGQKGMKLAGLQMRMAKERGEKDKALADQIANMKSSYSGGGGGNALGKAFAGGVSGFAKGGWAGAAAGAIGSMFS